ncbi:hypothetical protein HPG69_004005 [Diceros bicornis minor]|uniref:5',3'-nucleotidase, mitochondrial n=1 Tax=Diceros bicornis minor TaxID=77932 RepID=A0A7J7F5G1_DICBM|nr:hypothetical protein HPG69_004005 [Diceros bicornis minor]
MNQTWSLPLNPGDAVRVNSCTRALRAFYVAGSGHGVRKEPRPRVPAEGASAEPAPRPASQPRPRARLRGGAVPSRAARAAASLWAGACALAPRFPRAAPAYRPRRFSLGGHVSRPGPAGRRGPGPGARGERPRGAMIRLGGWCARRPRGAAGPAGRRGAAGGPAGRAGGRALRVLVDMDGVLADFEGGFLSKFRARFPEQPFIALEDRRGFWVSEQYGRLQPGLSEKAISIWESENFFFDLEPLPGAVEAVKQMANLENDTRLYPYEKLKQCEDM